MSEKPSSRKPYVTKLDGMALRVLKAFNESPEEPLTVRQLARRAEVHKRTVRHVLTAFGNYGWVSGAGGASGKGGPQLHGLTPPGRVGAAFVVNRPSGDDLRRWILYQIVNGRGAVAMTVTTDPEVGPVAEVEFTSAVAPAWGDHGRTPTGRRLTPVTRRPRSEHGTFPYRHSRGLAKGFDAVLRAFHRRPEEQLSTDAIATAASLTRGGAYTILEEFLGFGWVGSTEPPGPRGHPRPRSRGYRYFLTQRGAEGLAFLYGSDGDVLLTILQEVVTRAATVEGPEIRVVPEVGPTAVTKITFVI